MFYASCRLFLFVKNLQAVAKSIEGRKKRGAMTAVAFGYSQGMMFWVFAIIFYVGAVLIDNGTITFLAFFQAFFAVFLGAFGVGQVPKKNQHTLRKRFLCSAVPRLKYFQWSARSMLMMKNTHTRRW